MPAMASFFWRPRLPNDICRISASVKSLKRDAAVIWPGRYTFVISFTRFSIITPFRTAIMPALAELKSKLTGSEPSHPSICCWNAFIPSLTRLLLFKSEPITKVVLCDIGAISSSSLNNAIAVTIEGNASRISSISRNSTGDRVVKGSVSSSPGVFRLRTLL